MQLLEQNWQMGTEGNEEKRVMDALRRVVRTLRRSGSAAERTVGVSSAQSFVLQQLAAKPEQSVTELMARTLTSQSSVSEVVERLVAQRLISRRRAHDDARRVVLDLTTKGQLAARSTPSSAQGRLISGLRQMSSRERRRLAALLERWLAESGMERVAATMFLEDGSVRRTGTAGRRARSNGVDGRAAR
jgi:DNA-binding MarR family transcriptional regulator